MNSVIVDLMRRIEDVVKHGKRPDDEKDAATIKLLVDVHGYLSILLDHQAPADWATDLPTAPGWYWCYGFIYNDSPRAALYLLHAVGQGESMAFWSGNGRYLPDRMGAVMWLPIEEPPHPANDWPVKP